MHRRYLSVVLLAVAVVAALPLSASHAWSTYHWSRTSSQIAPPVVMNITSAWTPYDDRVMADWNKSAYIESPWSMGAISSRKRCTSTTGQIEVCNDTYGNNGWLGIAGISVSGGHIVKGYTKLNDTYFNTAKYNTPAWRRLVFCQEVGHDYGLGHTDETFGNYNDGTCMDYTNAPAGGIVNGFNYGPSNEYPNQHDYDQLAAIYSHTHSTLPFDAIVEDGARPRTMVEILHKADQWGTPIRFNDDGLPTVFFLKTGTSHDDHGNPIDDGELRHVFWAPEDPFEDLGPEGPKGERNH